jgi:hypothetical protein
MISGSRGGGYEEYKLWGYNAMYPVGIKPTFRRNMSPSSEILKMEATYYSEKSVDFHRVYIALSWKTKLFMSKSICHSLLCDIISFYYNTLGVEMAFRTGAPDR